MSAMFPKEVCETHNIPYCEVCGGGRMQFAFGEDQICEKHKSEKHKKCLRHHTDKELDEDKITTT